MVLGDRLRVMGSWWKLSLLPHEEVRGKTDSEKHEVHLNPLLDPTDVLHEVFHTIEFSFNVESEDQNLHALARGFVAVLADNPRFRRWLAAAVE